MNHFLTNYFEVEQFIDRGIGVGQKVGGQAFDVDRKGELQESTRICGGKYTKLTSKTHCDSLHIFCFHTNISAVSIVFAPKSGSSSTVTKESACVWQSGLGFFWHSAPTHTWKRRDMHMILSSYAPDISAVGTHGHVGQFPGGLTSIVVTCYFMCVGYGMFLMFKHWFCWKCQHNKYMFNFIDHLHFYTCKWLWAPGHWFSWGPIMLLRRPCLIYIYTAVKAALSDIHICISFIHCYWQWCINKLWNV